MDEEEFAEAGGAPTTYNQVAGVWEAVVDDLAATAAAYRDQGWEVVEVHPGNVAAMDGRGGGRDRWGLDVLVPDDEFAEIGRLVDEGCEFDGCEVFRTREDTLVLLVVAMLDADAGAAVVFPAYYDEQADAGMVRRVREAGQMQTHLRPLSEDPIVTFVQADVSLFLPDS